MNYLKIYCNLIRKAKSRTTLPEGCKEKHHIFPISIYGKNNRTVILSGREHYIAHALLEKICTKRYGLKHWKTIKMTRAHIMMKGNGNYVNSYLYEFARIRHSEANKGEIHPMFGKTLSEEHRAKISAAKKGKTAWNKGKPTSEETKIKISELQKGRTHSEETKAKMSESRRGRIITEETRKKLSEAHRGRTLSEEHRAKISAAKKGKTASEETKAKMSASHKKRPPQNMKKDNKNFEFE